MARYAYYRNMALLVDTRVKRYWYQSEIDATALVEISSSGWSKKALDYKDLSSMEAETPIEFDTLEEYEMLCLLMV